MKARKLTATTAVGTFTRKTARTYTHVIVVRSSAATEEARRLHDLHCVEFWLEQEKATEKKLNIDYYQRKLKEARAEQPVTQDSYYAKSWCGRPELVTARVDEFRQRYTEGVTAYPVDAP